MTWHWQVWVGFSLKPEAQLFLGTRVPNSHTGPSLRRTPRGLRWCCHCSKILHNCTLELVLCEVRWDNTAWAWAGDTCYDRHACCWCRALRAPRAQNLSGFTIGGRCVRLLGRTASGDDLGNADHPEGPSCEPVIASNAERRWWLSLVTQKFLSYSLLHMLVPYEPIIYGDVRGQEKIVQIQSSFPFSPSLFTTELKPECY